MSAFPGQSCGPAESYGDSPATAVLQGVSSAWGSSGRSRSSSSSCLIVQALWNPSCAPLPHILSSHGENVRNVSEVDSEARILQFVHWGNSFAYSPSSCLLLASTSETEAIFSAVDDQLWVPPDKVKVGVSTVSKHRFSVDPLYHLRYFTKYYWVHFVCAGFFLSVLSIFATAILQQNRYHLSPASVNQCKSRTPV